MDVANDKESRSRLQTNLRISQGSLWVSIHIILGSIPNGVWRWYNGVVILFVFFPLPQLKNKSILKEDLRLRKEYEETDNWPAHKGSNIERLVKKILLKPEIALYIKTLTLDYWQSQCEAESPDEDVDADFDLEEWLEEQRPARHVPYSAKDLALFNQALEEDGPLLRGGMDVQTIQDVLADGHQDTLVFMLIRGCPMSVRYVGLGYLLRPTSLKSYRPSVSRPLRLRSEDWNTWTSRAQIAHTAKSCL
jgi:hypothetical protein